MRAGYIRKMPPDSIAPGVEECLRRAFRTDAPIWKLLLGSWLLPLPIALCKPNCDPAAEDYEYGIPVWNSTFSESVAYSESKLLVSKLFVQLYVQAGGKSEPPDDCKHQCRLQQQCLYDHRFPVETMFRSKYTRTGEHLRV